MAKRATRGGYRVSRYNSLGYGVMVDGVLPSRGPDACLYADRCPESCKSACVAGGRCRHEDILLSGYVTSATEHYSYAKTWLSESEYSATIRQLGILSLQLARLSHRMHDTMEQLEVDSTEAVLRFVARPDMRYSTALHRRQQRLVSRLIDEATARHWGVSGSSC